MKGKTVIKLLTTAAVLTSVFAQPGTASGAKLGFQDAIDVCTTRAIRFGRMTYGIDADEPPAYIVQREYRSCVYAYSKQYPTREVEYRDTVFRLQKIIE